MDIVIVVTILIVMGIGSFLYYWQNRPPTPIPIPLSPLQAIGIIIGALVGLGTLYFIIRAAYKSDLTETPSPAVSIQLTETIARTEAPIPTQPPTMTPMPTEPPTATPTATLEPSTATPMPPEPPTATSVPPTEVSTLGIGSTEVGQDGMTLLYVPEGEFLRGTEEDDPNTDEDDDEVPQRSIYLDAFWIDKTEITNEMFAKFLNQKGNQVEDGVRWLNIDDENVLIFESGGVFEPKEGIVNHPVIDVTWYGAKSYCEWAGRRLPTEAEWEKAARGTDGRKYPWGNEFTGNKLNSCDNNCTKPYKKKSIDDGYANTAPVDNYPDGESPYGALNMVGNVEEWVADWYKMDYYEDAPLQNPTGPQEQDLTDKVLRGGSWDSSGARIARTAKRKGLPPIDKSHIRGFRCAASP